MLLAVEPHLDTVMNQALAFHAISGTGIDEHLNDPVLDDAGAHASLDVRSTPTLYDDVVNPVAREEMSEKETGRPCAHDDDLGLSTYDHATPPSAEANPVTLINFLVYPREY
jgi:hypothetical protein